MIEVGWVNVGDPKVQIQSNQLCSLAWGGKSKEREEGSVSKDQGYPSAKKPEGKEAQRQGSQKARRPAGKGAIVSEECQEAKGQEDKIIKDGRKYAKVKEE